MTHPSQFDVASSEPSEASTAAPVRPVTLLEFLAEEPVDLGNQPLEITHPRTQDSID